MLDLRPLHHGEETRALFQGFVDARPGDTIDLYVRRNQHPPVDLGAIEMRHLAAIRVTAEDTATRTRWCDALQDANQWGGRR